VDDFRKQCLTITAAFGISGVQVTRILDSTALFLGCPATIEPIRARNLPAAHSINGPLSMVWSYDLSSQESRQRTDFLRVSTIAFDDEYLNENWYSDILHARKIINDWGRTITSPELIHR